MAATGALLVDQIDERSFIMVFKLLRFESGGLLIDLRSNLIRRSATAFP
jgi:transcriptional regulator of aromatic amino acid metabolism